MTATAPLLKASYSGFSGAWHGVIKCDDEIIWRCEHAHRNRSHFTRIGGVSAVHCAAAAIEKMTREGCAHD